MFLQANHENMHKHKATGRLINKAKANGQYVYAFKKLVF